MMHLYCTVILTDKAHSHIDKEGRAIYVVDYLGEKLEIPTNTFMFVSDNLDHVHQVMKNNSYLSFLVKDYSHKYN